MRESLINISSAMNGRCRRCTLTSAITAERQGPHSPTFFSVVSVCMLRICFLAHKAMLDRQEEHIIVIFKRGEVN